MTEKKKPSSVSYRFFIPEDVTDPELRIVCWYERARVDLHWQDDGSEGTADLDKIISVLGRVVATARREVDVQRDLRGMDAELDNLLGDE